mgnify:CR=1 FL=1
MGLSELDINPSSGTSSTPNVIVGVAASSAAIDIDLLDDDDQKPFSTSTNYSVNDTAFKDGTLYAATESVTSGSAFNHTQWSVVTHLSNTMLPSTDPEDLDIRFTLDNVRLVTNGVASASIRFNFGRVKEPGGTEFENRPWRDLEGLYVCINVLGADGNSQLGGGSFFGVIVKQQTSFSGNTAHDADHPGHDSETKFSSLDSGTAICTVAGMEWFLGREKIYGSVVGDPASGAGSTVKINRPFTFNLKSGSSYDDPRQEQANMDAHLYNPPNSIVTAFTESDSTEARMWSADLIVYYLKTYHKPDLISTLYFSGLNYLEHFEPIISMEGRTFLEVLNEIASPRRGLCWTAHSLMWEEGIFLAINIRTIVPDNVTTAAGKTLLQNIHRVYINSPESNRNVLQCQIGNDLSRKFGKVVARGARMTSTFTIGASLNGILPAWNPASETLYKSGAFLGDDDRSNDLRRRGEDLAPVYSEFRINSGDRVSHGGNDYLCIVNMSAGVLETPGLGNQWQQIGDSGSYPAWNSDITYFKAFDPSNMIQFASFAASRIIPFNELDAIVFPDINITDGAADDPPAGTKNYNLQGMRFLRDLPLRSGYDYRTSPTNYVQRTKKNDYHGIHPTSPFVPTFGIVPTQGDKKSILHGFDQLTPLFNTGTAYAVGSLTTHEGVLYKNTTAIAAGTGAAFDASKWEEVSTPKHKEWRWCRLDRMHYATPDKHGTALTVVTKKGRGLSSYGIVVDRNSCGFKLRNGRASHCAASDWDGENNVGVSHGTFDIFSRWGYFAKGSKPSAASPEVSWKFMDFTVCAEYAKYTEGEVVIGSADSPITVPEFNAGSSYAVGAQVKTSATDQYVWEALVPLSPGAWDATKWAKKEVAASGELLIDCGDQFRLDYLTPHTVLDIENGIPVLADGGVLQDDREKLGAIARSAATWYATNRRQLTLQWRMTDWSSAQVGSNAHHTCEPGWLVTQIHHTNKHNDFLNAKTINTIITSVTYDFRQMTTTIQTGSDGMSFGTGRFLNQGDNVKAGARWA